MSGVRIFDLIGHGAIPTDGLFRAQIEAVLTERGWHNTGRRTRQGVMWISPMQDDAVPYRTAVNSERHWECNARYRNEAA